MDKWEWSILETIEHCHVIMYEKVKYATTEYLRYGSRLTPEEALKGWCFQMNVKNLNKRRQK
jgi:hypothetical protein